MHLTDSCQLTGLNLSNNRIHKLDELAELVTKVPHLKTLNLSHNEVRLTRHELNPEHDLFLDPPHTSLYCLAEVWPGAGQVERPETGRAVAEQESSVWPLQGPGVIHQVSQRFWGMRGEDNYEEDMAVCVQVGVSKSLYCITRVYSSALQQIDQSIRLYLYCTFHACKI